MTSKFKPEWYAVTFGFAHYSVKHKKDIANFCNFNVFGPYTFTRAKLYAISLCQNDKDECNHQIARLKALKKADL